MNEKRKIENRLKPKSAAIVFFCFCVIENDWWLMAVVAIMTRDVESMEKECSPEKSSVNAVIMNLIKKLFWGEQWNGVCEYASVDAAASVESDPRQRTTAERTHTYIHTETQKATPCPIQALRVSVLNVRIVVLSSTRFCCTTEAK